MSWVRGVVTIVYITAFAIALWSVVMIPSEAWQYFADWQKALFAFYLLVAFCGVLIAFWVWDDKDWMQDLEQFYNKKFEEIEERLERLERKE